MYTLTTFERRLIHGDQERDVQLEAGRVVWVTAQERHEPDFIVVGDKVALGPLRPDLAADYAR